MTERILFIDDEKNVLTAFQRNLRQEFDVGVALGGAEGLRAMALEPFAVVVCDMRMPEMDGVETLRQIAEAYPDTTRIMLTGNADQETAARAINEGGIFRFLTKPCADAGLRAALKAALRQYELVTAEKTLLEKTLAGSVRVLMDVLSVAQPEAFGRSSRVRQWAGTLAKELGIRNTWEIGLAAALAPIGLIGIPPDVVSKANDAESLTGPEKDLMASAPAIAHRFVTNIPRMQGVAQMLLNQGRGFDGTGFPVDGPTGTAIPEGARLLRLLNDLAAAGDEDTPNGAMVAGLRASSELYDPEMLQAVRRIWGKGAASAVAMRRVQKSVSIDGLCPGDRLMSDITLQNGKLLLGSGVQISMAQIERLRALRKLDKIKEPLTVGRLEEMGE